MSTLRTRALAVTLATITALGSGATLKAQPRVGSVLENGLVVAKISVTMNQVGFPYGRPISDYTLVVVTSTGERTAVTTGPAGIAEIHLQLGTYHAISIKPLLWFDHRYTWDVAFEVREGMHVVDLTPKNSVQERGVVTDSLPPD